MSEASRRSILLGLPAVAAAGAIPPAADAAVSEPSAEYREYRRCFDAFWAFIDAEPEHVDKTARVAWGVEFAALDDALRDAIEALRKKQVLTWSDVSEMGILAHDYAWDRTAQNYFQRCPQEIVRDLILAVLQLAPGDAVMHGPPPKRSPLTISN